MTSDPKPYGRAPAQRTAQEGAIAMRMRGYLTHDEWLARHEQATRLLQGPEPHRCLSYAGPEGPLAPFLRYAPHC